MKYFLLLAFPFLLTSSSVFYDFSTQTEYWTYAGGWQLRDNGVGGSTAGWGFNLQEDDFLASPPVVLNAGSTYTLTYRLDAQGSNRTVGVAINTMPTLGADTLQSVTIDANEDFNTLFSVPFTATTTGPHHVVVFNDGGTGFRKIIVDDIELSGAPLNQVPLVSLDYPSAASTTIPVGATWVFDADAADNDGTLTRVRFDVDGVGADSTTAVPYSGTWVPNLPGMHQLTALATDDEGAQYRSDPIDVNVVPNPWNSSYVGDVGNDAVRGGAIQPSGHVVLAANLSAPPTGVTPVYLNGATAGMEGYVLRFDADGTTLLSAAVVSSVVADLDTDALGRLYVAAGPAGLLRLDPAATALDYARPLPENAHRVATGPDGNVVALSDNENNYDATKLLDARVILFDSLGTQLADVSGATTFTTDVAIDENTRTIYSTGYKNFRTDDGSGRVFPVDVPVIKGSAFDGTQRFKAYDWSNDNTSPRWLNLSENNMADTRGTRLTVGDDGLLYVAFETDGGNHCLRYSPFDINAPVPIVRGDQYSDFFNSGTEPKTFVGRYDPLTGDYLLGQQFCARLSSGRANTVRTRGGDIAANAAGEVYVVGASAFGIPITLEYLPRDYRGGAYILKLSTDFSQRLLVTRLTRGKTHAVNLGPNGSLVVGGETSDPLFVNNAYQASAGGAEDGWFAVEPARLSLPVAWREFSVARRGKDAAVLRWVTAATEENAGYYVERSRPGGAWAVRSERLPGGEPPHQFTDPGLLPGTYLYRVRALGYDGSVSYSPVREFRVSDSDEMLVLPNPASDRFRVLNVTGRWRLFGPGGRVQRQGLGAGEVEIVTVGLPAGVYYFAGGDETLRVVIRR